MKISQEQAAEILEYLEAERKLTEEEMDEVVGSLLRNVFRRNDMNGAEAGTAPEQPKAFEMIIKRLAVCRNIASQLNIRTKKLANVYTGKNEPIQKDDCEKLEVDSVVLVHVLEDSLKTLEESLNETSDNLEELEKAW